MRARSLSFLLLLAGLIRFASPLLFGIAAASCAGGGGDGTTAPPKSAPPAATVAGTMSFVLGGTSGAPPSSLAALQPQARGSMAAASLVAGEDYIVSPRKAKITFTSVEFRGANGVLLGTSTLGDCTVTYDRSLSSASSLLDCAFILPVGDIHQIAVYFNKSMQLLVSDPTFGIYSNPASPTGFSTAAPVGGAAFVPFTVTIGDNSPTRATPIIFSSPVSIVAGSTPKLYITTDMIQTFQLSVNTGGTTLTPKANNDPVALFGGPTPGRSSFYSNANAIDSYKVGSVNAFKSLRIFYDQAGAPLFLMTPVSDTFCGAFDTPKGAWASPPMNGIGGWLGRDSNKILAWAVPQTTAYAAYTAYFVMAEPTAIGQQTILRCKSSASPPTPVDGKTYSSGAPAMPSADATAVLTLLAK